jgi:FtsZ-binding cell division protein ZapB
MEIKCKDLESENRALYSLQEGNQRLTVELDSARKHVAALSSEVDQLYDQQRHYKSQYQDMLLETQKL